MTDLQQSQSHSLSHSTHSHSQSSVVRQAGERIRIDRAKVALEAGMYTEAADEMVQFVKENNGPLNLEEAKLLYTAFENLVEPLCDQWCTFSELEQQAQENELVHKSQLIRDYRGVMVAEICYNCSRFLTSIKRPLSSETSDKDRSYHRKMMEKFLGLITTHATFQTPQAPAMLSVTLSNLREDWRFMAQLAQMANRYDEMKRFVDELINSVSTGLSELEHDLIFFAYRKVYEGLCGKYKILIKRRGNQGSVNYFLVQVMSLVSRLYYRATDVVKELIVRTSISDVTESLKKMDKYFQKHAPTSLESPEPPQKHGFAIGFLIDSKMYQPRKSMFLLKFLEEKALGFRRVKFSGLVRAIWVELGRIARKEIAEYRSFTAYRSAVVRLRRILTMLEKKEHILRGKCLRIVMGEAKYRLRGRFKFGVQKSIELRFKNPNLNSRRGKKLKTLTKSKTIKVRRVQTKVMKNRKRHRLYTRMHTIVSNMTKLIENLIIYALLESPYSRSSLSIDDFDLQEVAKKQMDSDHFSDFTPKLLINATIKGDIRDRNMSMAVGLQSPSGEIAIKLVPDFNQESRNKVKNEMIIDG